MAQRSGDARLDCTNNGVFNPNIANNNIVQYVQANITLTFNTTVSGTIDGAYSSGVLVVNDNDSLHATRNSVLPSAGTCGVSGDPPLSVPDVRYPCPQRGRVMPSRSLVWDGIQFPVPGAPNNLLSLPPVDGNGVPRCEDVFDQTSDGSCFNPVTTLRFTNLFVNAAAIGDGGVVIGTLTIFSAEGIAVTPSNTQFLSLVHLGLRSEVIGNDGGFQCVAGFREVTIDVQEGFANAFKVLGPPTMVQGNFSPESGYPLFQLGSMIPQPGAGKGGGATQAIRINVTFQDIPLGVTVAVPVEVTGSDDLTMRLVLGASAAGTGGVLAEGAGSHTLNIIDGDAWALYEVVDGDPFDLEEQSVIATFTCLQGSPTTNLVVWVGLVPLSDVGATAKFGPVPRFVYVGGVGSAADPERIGLFRQGMWLRDLDHSGGWNGAPPDALGFLGQAGDIPLVGAWSGGSSLIGIFRAGMWLLDYNGKGVWNGPVSDRTYFLGQAGDIPVVGDWNGDGADKIGIFRNGLWLLDLNGNGQWNGPATDRATRFGQAGDIPVVGDWNGDGADEIGFFRDGLWLLDTNGKFSDKPAIGNFAGGVADEIGFFRNGLWLLDLNGNGQWNGTPTDHLSSLGQAGDKPMIGDWNNDGLDEIGIFRNGLWLLDMNRNGSWNAGIDRIGFLGGAGDAPVTGRW